MICGGVFTSNPITVRDTYTTKVSPNPLEGGFGPSLIARERADCTAQIELHAMGEAKRDRSALVGGLRSLAALGEEARTVAVRAALLKCLWHSDEDVRVHAILTFARLSDGNPDDVNLLLDYYGQCARDFGKDRPAYLSYETAIALAHALSEINSPQVASSPLLRQIAGEKSGYARLAREVLDAVQSHPPEERIPLHALHGYEMLDEIEQVARTVAHRAALERVQAPA